jgi:hypothetical protein
VGVARRAPGDRTPPIGCVRGVVPSKKSSRACSSGGSTGKASRHNGQEFVSPSHFEMHSSWNKCWHGIRATVSSEWNSSVQTAHTLQPSAPRENISCGAAVHGERGSCSTALHHRATLVSAVLYSGTLMHRWMNVPAGRRQVGSRACSGLIKYSSHQRSLRIESVRVQLSAVHRLTAGGTGTCISLSSCDASVESSNRSVVAGSDRFSLANAMLLSRKPLFARGAAIWAAATAATE